MSDPVQPVAGISEAPRAAARELRAETRDTPTRADPQAVVASIEALGGQIRFGNRTAEFSYDADLHRVVIKIFSAATEPREVVRQIPPEDYLAFSARYRELLGLLFDEQV